jgi:flagellar capping protein FliD
MDRTSTVLAFISVLGTISSIFFAILAFRRNDRGDQKQIGKSEGVLISDVGYIKSSIDRIEKTLDKLEERYNDLDGRLIKVESETSNLATKFEEHIRNKHLHGKGGI